MQSRAELPDEPPRALTERLARPAEVERQEGAEPRHDLEDDQLHDRPADAHARHAHAGDGLVAGERLAARPHGRLRLGVKLTGELDAAELVDHRGLA